MLTETQKNLEFSRQTRSEKIFSGKQPRQLMKISKCDLNYRAEVRHGSAALLAPSKLPVDYFIMSPGHFTH